MNEIKTLETFDKKTKLLNVIIETPQGSRNKYKFDTEKGVFTLSGVMPLGMSFPFDFGYIPQTLGEDGDPVDVLLLMDASTFTGCLVPSRLIGVVEALQTERGKTFRNDRLIAVANESLMYKNVKTFKDLNKEIVEQIKGFFIFYNELKGKKLKILGQFGIDKAKKLVAEGIKKAEKENS